MSPPQAEIVALGLGDRGVQAIGAASAEATGMPAGLSGKLGGPDAVPHGFCNISGSLVTFAAIHVLPHLFW